MADIAVLGLELNAQGLVRGSAEGKTALSGVTGAAHQTEGALGAATKAAAALGITFAAYKVAQWAKDTLTLGARYETLGVAMGVVGRNAFQTSADMDRLQTSLENTGISMLEARNNLARMASAELDLEQSTKLARIAQDAAVIANTNSSESFERLITGITTGQPRILRTLGIFVDFNDALDRGAKEMGKTAQALSEVESSQIRANAVMDAGTRIAGAYEAAMGTAGKQLNSTVRYLEDMRVKASEAFQPAYTAAVFAYANALKVAGENAEKISGAVRIMLALFAAKVVSEATARLAAYNATLAQSTAAHITQARAVATANATESFAATTRLAAMQNRLRAETLLGASTERLIVLERQLALAQTQVSMTGAAATASATALTAATTLTGRAMATAGALAKGAWAAIGGPIGAAVIGALAINAILDKYLAKMVQANELTAEEQALWEKTQKIWADRDKAAAEAAEAEKERMAAQAAAAEAAAEKAREAAKEARGLALELDHQKALVVAFGATTAAMDVLNLQYEERAALAKNAESYSGADLARLNELTRAIYAQRQALAELEEQRRKTEQASIALTTESDMISGVAGGLIALEKELEARRKLLAATLEGEAAVRKLAIAEAGAAAAAEAIAAGMPETAERMRTMAEEAAAIGFALQDAADTGATDLADALSIISRQLGGMARDVGQVVVQFVLMAEAAKKAADAKGAAFGTGQWLGAGAGGVAPAVISMVLSGVIGSLFGDGGGEARREEARKEAEDRARAAADFRKAVDRFAEAVGGTPTSIGKDAGALLGMSAAAAIARQEEILRQMDRAREGLDPRDEGGYRRTLKELEDLEAEYAKHAEIIEEYQRRIAEVTALYRGELEIRMLVAQGMDDEAARRRMEIQQQQEYAKAVADGWDEATLALLTLTQEAELTRWLEDLAEAAQQAADATRALVDDLTARALDLTGQGGAAATFRLGIRQRSERESASGESPEVLALMDIVHTLERSELAAQQAIGAVNDGLELQLAALNDQADAAREAYESQDAALADQLEIAEAQLRVQERMVDELRRVVDRLSEFRQSLLTSDLSVLSPVQQLEVAREEFERLAALARAGDVTAGGALPGAARTFLDVSRDVNASGAGFQGDFSSVMAVLADTEGRFAAQLSIEEQMLAELRTQVDELQRARDAAQAQYDGQIAAAQEQMRIAREEAARQIQAIQAAAEAAAQAARLQIDALLRQIELLNSIRDRIELKDVPPSGDWVYDPITKTWRRVGGDVQGVSSVEISIQQTNSKLDTLIGWVASHKGSTDGSIAVLQSGMSALASRLDRIEAAVDRTTSQVRKSLEEAF